MRQRRLKRASIAAILGLFFAASVTTAAAAEEPAYPELPNFHQVDGHLFRGAQPKAGGFAALKKLGVRTIVNLRHEPSRVMADQATAEEAGLRYFNVPMHGLGRPTPEQVERVQTLILDPDNWPVFVHCKAGADRTGVMIAYYRVAQAGWTAEEAIREAMRYGMMKIETRKRSFIREFYAKLQDAGGGADSPSVAGVERAMPH